MLSTEGRPEPEIGVVAVIKGREGGRGLKDKNTKNELDIRERGRKK